MTLRQEVCSGMPIAVRGVAGNQRHRRRVRPLGLEREFSRFRVGLSFRRQERIRKSNEAGIEVVGRALRSAPRAPQAVVGGKQGAVSSFAGVVVIDAHDGISFARVDPRVVGPIGEEDGRSVRVDGVDAGGFGEVIGNQGQQEEFGDGLALLLIWQFHGAHGTNRIGKGFQFRRVRRVVSRNNVAFTVKYMAESKVERFSIQNPPASSFRKTREVEVASTTYKLGPTATYVLPSKRWTFSGGKSVSQMGSQEVR
mmetsp:Transcript_827/g.1659  ORF Transcript_827/g.1659 Transcript_827/m.1659 type:complete len:254 (-) Transcript_827:197-958(-)